ncbi:hypothetical protein OAF84_00465 [Akkermansiaceae bacterium]|nr:hypothetical protein [bacterium]MDB4745465.1 hypothetical protein [bacterium]MDB4753736.1 hypothetical protein [Akkermansiaceae bacterium]
MILAFCDLKKAVQWDFRPLLCLARGRPVYLEAIDLPRVTQSNILAKWIGSEAPAGIDPLVYGSGLNIDTDTGTG